MLNVMERIQDYRQPIVTATGIFLGFMLNFAANWLGNAFTKHMFRDVVVAVSVTLSISLLLVVLYRILSMNYPTDRINAYYQRTLRLFLIAVAVPFVAWVLIVLRMLVNGNTGN